MAKSGKMTDGGPGCWIASVVVGVDLAILGKKFDGDGSNLGVIF